jgi:hypothetical protein
MSFPRKRKPSSGDDGANLSGLYPGQPAQAPAREKAMKKWRRAWKLQLIERDNPVWRDLSSDLI